jgi:hypothetical protein
MRNIAINKALAATVTSYRTVANISATATNECCSSIPELFIVMEIVEDILMISIISYNYVTDSLDNYLL